MDLEVDLLPVRDHPPDVLVALGLEDDRVGRLAAERAPEADRPQARRLLPLVPPLARLGRRRRRVTSAACSSRTRSEEHTSELQSPCNLVCRLLLEKKKN